MSTHLFVIEACIIIVQSNLNVSLLVSLLYVSAKLIALFKLFYWHQVLTVNIGILSQWLKFESSIYTRRKYKKILWSSISTLIWSLLKQVFDIIHQLKRVNKLVYFSTFQCNFTCLIVSLMSFCYSHKMIIFWPTQAFGWINLKFCKYQLTTWLCHS